MLCLLKAAALGAVLSMNVLTLSSAPTRAGEGLPRSAQMLDANVYVPERLTLTAPSLPDDTFAVEKPSRAPRWVVFDFVTGIRTVELADGSMHEELFEPEPLVQMVLSTMPKQEMDSIVRQMKSAVLTAATDLAGLARMLQLFKSRLLGGKPCRRV